MFNSNAMFALTFLAIIVININAIHKSRKGRTGVHTLAFISGVTGLCGLPLAIIAALPLALQFLTPAHGSPESVMFFSIGIILIVATLFSAMAGIFLQVRGKEIPAHL